MLEFYPIWVIFLKYLKCHPLKIDFAWKEVKLYIFVLFDNFFWSEKSWFVLRKNWFHNFFLWSGSTDVKPSVKNLKICQGFYLRLQRLKWFCEFLMLQQPRSTKTCPIIFPRRYREKRYFSWEKSGLNLLWERGFNTSIDFRAWRSRIKDKETIWAES